MATEAEALVLRMSADLRRFEKEMARMRQTADKRLTEVERRAMQSDKRLSRISRGMGENMVNQFRDGLRGMAPVLAGAFSTAAVLKYADAWTAGRNALAAAGVATADLTARQNELVDVANRSRTGSAETIALYQRLSIATAELGLSQAKTLQLTELLNKSFQAGGLSTQEAASAALQLSQALASGALQGDELRSLRENAPLVAKAIADAMGVSIGALKDLGAEGKITSQVIVDALFGASAQIESTFGKTTATVGQALTVLNNELGRFVGQTDAGLSATERMAQGIILLAENLEFVATTAGVAVTIVGTRMVVAYGAASVAAARLTAFQVGMTASMTGTTRAALLTTSAMGALRASMLFLLTNPIGIAITAIAAALALVAIKAGDATTASEDLTRSNDALKEATDAYTAAAEAAAVATGESARVSREAAKAARDEAVARRENARAALAEAQSIIAVIGAKARQRIEAETFNFRGDRAGTTTPISPADQGRVRQARADAEAAAEAIKAADAAISAADQRLARGGGAGGGNGAAPGGGGRAARDAESAREMLDLERDILAARATGDQAAIDAAEERLLLAQTIQKYERAGYENAEARAREEIGWLNEIEGLEERRAAMADLLSTYRENDARKAQEATERAREENDILMDQLDLEAELARLRGDKAAQASAERRYFIERETNRILSQRKDITEEQARAEATGRYDQLRAADIIGGLGRDDPAAQAAALYEEVDRLRQEDLLSEEEAAQRRAQINAEYNEARLQDTRSMLDSLAGLQNSSNKKLAAIGKAAAITQATIDGYLAVQKALASAPPPFNFVQAAIVGAAAAANVASIAGMKDGGVVSGPGGPRDDKVPVMLSNGEFVVNAASAKRHRALLESVNRGGLPAMADGGLVGQVARLSSVSARPVGGSSLTYAPTLDARGADLGVVRRLERLMAEQSAQLEGKVTDIVSRREQYRLGSGRKGRRA